MAAEILTIGALVVVVSVIAFAVVRRETIFDYERGLKFTRGKYQGLVDPGSHWYLSPITTVKKIDIRRRIVSIPGQEVLTSDSVSLKLSMLAEYRVDRPEVAVLEVEHYEIALYGVLQLALREIIGQVTITEVLENRAELSEQLFEACHEEIAKLGVALDSVNIKDIMFPGTLKQTFGQVAAAKQEGLAALERARGESAALRNLANAAKLLETNPGLFRLRMLQAISETSGNSITLELSDGGIASPGSTKVKKRKTE